MVDQTVISGFLICLLSLLGCNLGVLSDFQFVVEHSSRVAKLIQHVTTNTKHCTYMLCLLARHCICRKRLMFLHVELL
jgi:hypothetical protein